MNSKTSFISCFINSQMVGSFIKNKVQNQEKKHEKI